MTILLFIAIILLLIIVHELGHFFVAKRAGIRVDEFGVGFPPRAATLVQKGETSYTLNWIPFGGFVRIFGEDPAELTPGSADYTRSFVAKPWYVQAAVLVAGVTMNVLVAWFLFAAAFMIGVPAAATETSSGDVVDPRLTVVEVLPQSPAEAAGIAPGSIITEARTEGGFELELTPEAIIGYVQNQHEPLHLTYERAGEETTVTVAPTAGLIKEAPDRPALGLALGMVGTMRLGFFPALMESGIHTARYLGLITVSLIGFFADALTWSADVSQVAGPVGIVSLVGEAAATGFVSLLTFTAVISLHLAVINLFPVPALDGGRLLFVFIEKIKGSPIKPRVAQAANSIGFAVLILLMVVVTLSDISKLIS